MTNTLDLIKLLNVGLILCLKWKMRFIMFNNHFGLDPIGGVSSLYGTQIVTNVHLGEEKQVKFPRSKKKRIQKKWRKNRKYYEFVPSNKVHVIQGSFGEKIMMCHPSVYVQIQKEFAQA